MKYLIVAAAIVTVAAAVLYVTVDSSYLTPLTVDLTPLDPWHDGYVSIMETGSGIPHVTVSSVGNDTVHPDIVFVYADELPWDALRYAAPYWLQALTAQGVALVTGGIPLGATVLLPRAWISIEPQCTGLVRIVDCILLALCLGYFVKRWPARLTMVGMALIVGFMLNVFRIVGMVP